MSDLSWLLGRGYSQVAALKLVGDKYALQKRQRMAVLRCACAADKKENRLSKSISELQLVGRDLVIDGFNCFITTEAALSGGVILQGQDSALRDLASVHGNYRKVEETRRALELFVEVIARGKPRSVTWFLDRPVSNSGSLATLIRSGHPDWTVELVFNPDKELVANPDWVVASSDAWVLDQCRAWFDLTTAAVADANCNEWRIDLSGPTGP